MTKGLGKCPQVSKLLYIKLQKTYQANKCCAFLQAMGEDTGEQAFACKI